MGDKVQIFIKTINGNIVTMEVETSKSIKDVMDDIQAREGIAPKQQRLIFAAEQQLEDVGMNSCKATEHGEGSSELFTQTSDSSYVPEWSQASSVEQTVNKEQLWLVKMDAILNLFR
jgi:hypothetical protein